MVAPTEHLKRQWADAASRVGVQLDPSFKNSDGRHGRHFHGIAVTYAQVAMRPALHRRWPRMAARSSSSTRCTTAGMRSAGATASARRSRSAKRRLSLTGTPFRSDASPIPFVTYLEGADGIRTSRPDYSYGYGRALTDGVVRPVIFLTYAGTMRWRTRTGDEMEARLGEGDTKDVTAQAWRTALDPEGEWMPAVLRAADQRLTEVRRGVPDAGGLVIATDHYAARAYASLLQDITGQQAVLVLSDEKAASRHIEAFAKSDRRWMVAVRMVSEGVDIPRLGVGVYATSASTPLFFAQAVGRYVRTRRRGETASIFLPSVPSLTALAGQLELERDHALDRVAQVDLLDDALLVEANRSEPSSPATYEFDFKAIESSATFDRVLFDGTRVRHRRRGRQPGGAGLPRHPGAAGAGPGARVAAGTSGAAVAPRRRTVIAWLERAEYSRRPRRCRCTAR